MEIELANDVDLQDRLWNFSDEVVKDWLVLDKPAEDEVVEEEPVMEEEAVVEPDEPAAEEQTAEE